MSDHNTNQKRDFSFFEKMSTERLQAYLEQDYLLPDEESDIEAVVYVMEVLARRAKSEQENSGAVKAPSWEEFSKRLENHADSDHDDMDIDVDAIDQIIRNQYGDTSQQPSKQKSTPRRKIIALRAMAVAAIIIATLLFGSLAFYAAGFDLFGAIAKWTQETFGFSTQDEQRIEDDLYPNQLLDLFLLLVKNGVPDIVLPKYLPGDFENVNTESYEGLGSIVCFAQLADGDSDIIIQYRIRNDRISSFDYEKDSGNPEIYSTNAGDYYISTNMGKYQAMWLFENVECSISGVESREELFLIIDSIGE